MRDVCLTVRVIVENVEISKSCSIMKKIKVYEIDIYFILFLFYSQIILILIRINIFNRSILKIKIT